MDGVDQVDDVAEQITALHAIGDTAKDGGDHVTPIAPAVHAAKAAQMSEEAGAARAIRPDRLVGVDKGEQVRPSDSVALRGPIAPAVGRLDRGVEGLTRQRRLVLVHPLQVVEELQKHDPGEHGQPVQVAVQPLVLTHDLPRRLDDAVEALGCGLRGGGGLRSSHTGPLSGYQAA